MVWMLLCTPQKKPQIELNHGTKKQLTQLVALALVPFGLEPQKPTPATFALGRPGVACVGILAHAANVRTPHLFFAAPSHFFSFSFLSYLFGGATKTLA